VAHSENGSIASGGRIVSGALWVAWRSDARMERQEQMRWGDIQERDLVNCEKVRAEKSRQ